MDKIVNFFNGMISSATYTISGVTKSASIYKTDVSGNTITKWVYLADTDAGAITDVKLLSGSGEILADRPDSIQKATNKGVLFSFKFTISEV